MCLCAEAQERVTFWQEAQNRAGAGPLQPLGDLLTEGRSLCLQSKGSFPVLGGRIGRIRAVFPEGCSDFNE